MPHSAEACKFARLSSLINPTLVTYFIYPLSVFHHIVRQLPCNVEAFYCVGTRAVTFLANYFTDRHMKKLSYSMKCIVRHECT